MGNGKVVRMPDASSQQRNVAVASLVGILESLGKQRGAILLLNEPSVAFGQERNTDVRAMQRPDQILGISQKMTVLQGADGNR